MQINIYGVIGVIVLTLFEVLIIIDLFKVIKFKKYTILWLPIIVDIILLILIPILLYTVFSMPNDYKSVSFAKMYLIEGKVQLIGAVFSFIRIVLVERLKRK